MVHKLKITNERFKSLITTAKKSVIRFNDRDYQRQDILIFTFIDGLSRGGEWIITHIHSGLGLKEGYVVLSLERINEEQ